MDQLSPAWYRDESPEASLAATRESIAHIREIDPGMELVRPVITPRFAPSCSAPLMKGLGQLAKETRLPVQTHISENKGEIALVLELFPPSSTGAGGPARDTYAGVYDAFGLLTERTILAHAIHLSEEEADLIAMRGAKVSHCPCSNSAITSGAARVRWLLGKGIATGLGTDMSGGYSPSVLEAARLASLVSRHVAMGGDEAAKLSVEEVLYLATRGGAEVVGLEGRVGAFEVGMEWDAQLVGLAIVDSDGGITRGERDGNVDIFGWENWEERVAKWVFNGDDRNTKKVWVRGRLVHE
jgi:guanine deaminase